MTEHGPRWLELSEMAEQQTWTWRTLCTRPSPPWPSSQEPLSPAGRPQALSLARQLEEQQEAAPGTTANRCLVSHPSFHHPPGELWAPVGLVGF